MWTALLRSEVLIAQRLRRKFSAIMQSEASGAAAGMGNPNQ